MLKVVASPLSRMNWRARGFLAYQLSRYAAWWKPKEGSFLGPHGGKSCKEDSVLEEILHFIGRENCLD